MGSQDPCNAPPENSTQGLPTIVCLLDTHHTCVITFHPRCIQLAVCVCVCLKDCIVVCADEGGRERLATLHVSWSLQDLPSPPLKWIHVTLQVLQLRPGRFPEVRRPPPACRPTEVGEGRTPPGGGLTSTGMEEPLPTGYSLCLRPPPQAPRQKHAHTHTHT